MNRGIAAVLVALFVSAPLSALAQGTTTPPAPAPTAAPETPEADVAEASTPTPDATTGERTEAIEKELTAEEIKLRDEQTLHEEKEGVEKRESGTDPTEDPEKDYFFLGLMGGVVILPSFLMNLFLEESQSIVNPAVGAEFTYRNDGFSIVASLFYAGYRGHGPFQVPGDPDTDVEWIDSNLGAVMGTVTFLWSTEFSQFVALEYGVGIGVGYLAGHLTRTEAYRKSNGDWAKCKGPNNPSEFGNYCGTNIATENVRGEQYGVPAKNWNDGGDVPLIWPWLSIPQIGLRIKPVRQMQIRVNASFGLGFYLGTSVAYGF